MGSVEPKRRGRPPKQPVDIQAEWASALPAHDDRPSGSALNHIVNDFRTRFPEEWESLRLCPLQHGLETMAELMKG